MLKAVWQKFDHDWGWNLARLLAYTCIMGLFSVLGLELVLLSLFLRIASPDAEQGVVRAIVRLLPDRVTGAAVMSFADGIEHAPFILVLLGLPVALWYGTRFFVVIESCLCVIFRRQQRTFLRQNRVALLMLLLFAAALPVMVVSATFTPVVNIGLSHSTIPHSRLANEPTMAALAMFVSLALNFLILLIFYSFVTPKRRLNPPHLAGRAARRCAGPGVYPHLPGLHPRGLTTAAFRHRGWVRLCRAGLLLRLFLLRHLRRGTVLLAGGLSGRASLHHRYTGPCVPGDTLPVQARKASQSGG